MNDSKQDTHPAVVGGKNAEFCSRCGRHWSDECHTRSMAIRS